MNNRKIMLKALNKSVIKDLLSRGFTGKYPHFRKVKEDCIELIDFQANKYGGSFTVEVSAVFPDSINTNLTDKSFTDMSIVDASYTNERYRLEGMFDGWFYYRDVYKMPQGFYHDVPEKEAENFESPDGWEFVQPFDELAADEICEEINLQLEDAFNWLVKFEYKNRKSTRRSESRKSEEEKVVNSRLIGFIVGFFVCLLIAWLFFFAEETFMGILFLICSIFQIIFMFFTPVSYVFSPERVVIKYFFGLEENTTWGRVFSVLSGRERPTRYSHLEFYELIYREEQKRYFFMQGRIIKNKKTRSLMKKYCPKKVD